MSRGARGLLATPAGSVGCDLEPLERDAAGARYELRVRNGTGGLLTATAYAVRTDARRPVAALAVEVEPHAQVRTGFTLDAGLSYGRVLAEVRGDGIHLVVEAAPPRGGPARRPWLTGLVAFGGAAVLAGASLLAIAGLSPRVLEAALTASPGGELVARWQTAGAGARSYELRDAAGAVVAHGSLPGPSGALPLGRGGDAATLRVAIANPFGSNARDAVFARATSPPAVRIAAPPAPRVVSLTVDAGTGDAPLAVRYVTQQARALQLAIVDRSGVPWFATTVTGGSGVLRVPAPPAGSREPYALVATAQGTGTAAHTRVPIPAAPSPSPSPGALAGDGVDAGLISGGQLRVTPLIVSPGGKIEVDLPDAGGGRVAIVRELDGAEVAGVDVAPGSRSAVLTLPSEGNGPYSVRATTTRGPGSMTLLQHLTVGPRRR